jgi:hypothetical protein
VFYQLPNLALDVAPSRCTSMFSSSSRRSSKGSSPGSPWRAMACSIETHFSTRCPFSRNFLRLSKHPQKIDLDHGRSDVAGPKTLSVGVTAKRNCAIDGALDTRFLERRPEGQSIQPRHCPLNDPPTRSLRGDKQHLNFAVNDPIRMTPAWRRTGRSRIIMAGPTGDARLCVNSRPSSG